MRKLSGVFLLLGLLACGAAPDLEQEKQKLLALHAAQQRAHFEKDAAAFVGQFADTLLSVNRGLITAMAKPAALQRFQHYFAGVTFVRWEDLRPPRIAFSADATMAWMLVDKLVVLRHRNAAQQLVEESTHFAWVSIFRKQPGGDWKIDCNISTNEAATEQPVR